MLGTCCRTWAPSAPSTVPPPSAATIQLSPPAANLTCMPGIGGTDLPADVLVLPASRRLHITGRVQRPARGSSTHACPSAHYRRTGIARADLCAPHWTPTRSRDTTAPGYRMSSREHTGMVDLGADGDPRTHRVISKESAICLDPPPGGPAEPITLRDKLACVWKQLLAALAALSQISVAVDLRSMTK